jgi:hypothetical protein
MPFRWMPAKGNLLTLCGEAQLAVSPSLDTLTPESHVSDGRPSTPIRWGTKAAEVEIRCTLNLLRNPGFESADMSDWTVLSGTSVRTTTPSDVASGAAALQFMSAAVRYQDVEIPSGIPFRISALLSGAMSAAAYVVVLNLDTGRFLDNTGAWVADATVRTLARTTNFYAEVSQAPTVEAFSVTGRYLTRLRVHVGGEASATFADAIELRPAWNFIGLFGHNLTARGEYVWPGTPFSYYGQVPRYEYQQEDVVQIGWIVPGGEEGIEDGQAHRIPWPNTWNVWPSPKSGPDVTITIVSDQYAHYPIPSVGEIVVGYVEDLLPAGFPFKVGLMEAGQVRNETAAGDAYVYNPGPNALRDLTLRWTYVGDAAEEVLRDRLYRVSRGGADGVILVPPDNLVEGVGCIFGLPEADFGYSIEAPTTGPELLRTATLAIRELPSPEMAED